MTPPHAAPASRRLSIGRAGKAGPTFLHLLCVAGAMMLLTSCFKRESAVQRGDREGILHRGIGADPTDLDPHIATNLAEVDLVSALFEGLVVEDPVDLHPVPGVAARWDISPDQIARLQGLAQAVVKFVRKSFAFLFLGLDEAARE